LEVGDIVWVKTSNGDKGERGVIEKKRREPDSYNVRIKGRSCRRTRKHLRKLNVARPIGRGSDSDSEQGDTEERVGSSKEDTGTEESEEDESSEASEREGEGRLEATREDVAEVSEHEGQGGPEVKSGDVAKDSGNLRRSKRVTSKNHLSRDFVWDKRK
jgi:cobalamin biosynthesis protein CobT